MRLNGLHLLLTYRCNLECDHCFVWGSPWNYGTMTLENLKTILKQAQAMESVEWIYFEGGEVFLYYPLLLAGVEEASSLGYKVGIVSNGYWATSVEDAVHGLRPFVGKVDDLSISNDHFHWDAENSSFSQNICTAAEQLGIPVGIISIVPVDEPESEAAHGQLPIGISSVMHRGRAVEKLADHAPQSIWTSFDQCPYENLRNPGRIHIDPLGNVHLCQGISLGNVFERELADICASYDPESNPIVDPLLNGGPAELVRCYELSPQSDYADACHLCYTARERLRHRFPEILGPDQMYGVLDA